MPPSLLDHSCISISVSDPGLLQASTRAYWMHVEEYVMGEEDSVAVWCDSAAWCRSWLAWLDREVMRDRICPVGGGIFSLDSICERHLLCFMDGEYI